MAFLVVSYFMAIWMDFLRLVSWPLTIRGVKYGVDKLALLHSCRLLISFVRLLAGCKVFGYLLFVVLAELLFWLGLIRIKLFWMVFLFFACYSLVN